MTNLLPVSQAARELLQELRAYVGQQGPLGRALMQRAADFIEHSLREREPAPSSERELLREKLGEGEFYVNGDDFDLIWRPGPVPNSFASLDQIVARMACGETAYWLPSVVARLLNAALASTTQEPALDLHTLEEAAKVADAEIEFARGLERQAVSSNHKDIAYACAGTASRVATAIRALKGGEQ